jgi:hypothetical protein
VADKIRNTDYDKCICNVYIHGTKLKGAGCKYFNIAVCG